MDITCTVSLATGDHLAMSSEEAATAVLTALGGDTGKDVCRLSIVAPPAMVGTSPAPPLTPA